MAFKFERDFTLGQVQEMLPNNPDANIWYPHLYESFIRYEITSVYRIAAFMAETAYESLDYTQLEENMNYSAKALLRVFSKYFNEETAATYERQPELIANIVYSNRMGNGDYSSGDGWNFRGRGIIQLTGRNNYTIASRDIYGNDFLIENPWIVASFQYPEVPVETACWYWNTNRLNYFADADDIDTISYRINGGWNGKIERMNYYVRNKEILT